MKRLILLSILTLSFILLATPIIKIRAQNLFPSCDIAPSAAACQSPPQSHQSNSFYGKNGILTKVVGLIALATGIVAVVMIIISGFKFVTSSGDPNNIKSAKNTLIYAIVGLVVAALAGAIIQFVLNRL